MKHAVRILSLVLLVALIRVPASAAATTPIRVLIPFQGRFAGVAAITEYDGTWWAAGSFVDNSGQHRPGLWTSTDSHTWMRIDTAPITGYGEVSELYSVAASDRGVVALGAATGGAHGNPRTVSWILRADNMLHEVPAGFELYNGPRQIAVRTVSAAPGGWVIIGARNNQNNRLGATAWTSSTGDDFVIHDDDPALSGQPTEQVIGLDVTQQANRLIAVGERGVPRGGTIDTDAIAWTSADGRSWNRWSPPTLRLGGREAQRAQRIAARGIHVVIGGTETNNTRTRFVAWTTLDALHWRRSVIPQLGVSGDVLSNVTSVAAGDSKMYVAARAGDRLRLVSSTAGRAWTNVALPRELPTGSRARLAIGAAGNTLLVGATDLSGGGLWRLNQ